MAEPAGVESSESRVVIDLRGITPLPRPDARLAIHEGERLSSGIHRVYRAELTNALEELRHDPNRDRAVHESRKSLKRARALLRLVRDDLGQFAYRQENVVLRDVGRALSPVRSAAVHADLAATLAADATIFLRQAEKRWLVSSLHRHHERRREAVMGDRQLMADLTVTLTAARSRASGFANAGRSELGFAAVEPSVRRVYRRGLSGFEASQDVRTEQAIHEWRKRTKYLRHQLEALQQVWPHVVGGTALALHRLGELLGDEHDLAELAAIVNGEPALIPGAHRRAAFLNAVHVRRRRIQDDAFSLGATVFAEPPRVFTARLQAAWSHWRRSYPVRRDVAKPAFIGHEQ